MYVEPKKETLLEINLYLGTPHEHNPDTEKQHVLKSKCSLYVGLSLEKY